MTETNDMKWPLIITYTFLTVFFSVSIVGGMIESHHGFEEATEQRHCRQELVEKFEDLNYDHMQRQNFQAWTNAWIERCPHEGPGLNQAVKDLSQALSSSDRPLLLPEEKETVASVYNEVIRPRLRAHKETTP